METRPRTDEEPAVGPGGGQGEAAFDQRPDLGDQGHDAGALALGAFVDQPAGRGGGLAADGPEPALGVDVDCAAAGDLADAGGGGGGEHDDVAPAAVLVGRAGDEGVGEGLQRAPVGQGEAARVVELVLDALVLVLPAADAGGIAIDDAVAQRLFHDAYEHGQGVLDRGAARAIGDPAGDSAVDLSGSDEPGGEVSQRRDDPVAPASQIGDGRLGFQPAKGELECRFAVVREGLGEPVRVETLFRGVGQFGEPVECGLPVGEAA
ncbi:hypothetical protein [Pseudonocardia charpentierae]|uniref:Uncharacterized protein n=1 Tax=Pseudonocardia charpentierae TaxID=3075545 RepID=A0ABU2NGL3_9PSEU|nr:hypothetical protein [Pseudonocardia sp. DSM 45834]MDT0353100.1 hypothetical protein [Pseudonocardia sp. DSM 45834]